LYSVNAAIIAVIHTCCCVGSLSAFQRKFASHFATASFLCENVC